jgi:tellurite methyltransferase
MLLRKAKDAIFCRQTHPRHEAFNGINIPMKTDREKWDKRYSRESRMSPGADEFLVRHADILTSGRALDPACGLGGNSIFLAEHGYEVDAIDISVKAISRLGEEVRSRGLPIRCITADLDYFPLPADTYDMVVVFYFFSETLITGVREALKQRGLLFFATFNTRHTSVMPTFNPAYLIPPDGLAAYFTDFDILTHETSAGDHGNVSRLICRKS